MQWLRAEPRTLMLANGYTRPEQLGADRWAAMLGIAANTAKMRGIVDLLLEPPVESFSILDAGPLDRIAELGYRDTLARVKDWRPEPTRRTEAAAG